LAEVAADRSRWRKGHASLTGSTICRAAADHRLEAQYLFEESCAKTLYNLSGEPAPFDREVSFQIVPNALTLARLLKISDAEIVQAIMS
jgi:hypothetical protein